ncbi:hypothetical protein [Streptomyces sp. IBSBF 3010]|uniref:hypothetical protein n=1 Tax=Streptomyces sp. IBSBF 3010 TaxID=2903526 RepID=UPI002FDC42CF
MNLYISAVNALIFAVACTVAYVVYGRTKSQQATDGPAAKGDLTAALTAAAAALLMLAFLFGVGDGSSTGVEPAAPNRPSAPACLRTDDRCRV